MTWVPLLLTDPSPNLRILVLRELLNRPEEDEEVGRIFRAERWHRDRFVEAHGSPLYGPQRLRLQVGLLPSARRFHFRYYLELLRRTPA